MLELNLSCKVSLNIYFELFFNVFRFFSIIFSSCLRHFLLLFRHKLVLMYFVIDNEALRD